MTDGGHSADDTDQKECVVCGSENHDGDGWIYHTSDTEIVGMTPEGGVERELKEHARPVCSIPCKDEFKQSDEWSLQAGGERSYE